MRNTITPYQTIKAEAIRQQLPVAYKEDLTKHDRSTLRKFPASGCFVWQLRESGTELYTHLSPGGMFHLAYMAKNWRKCTTYIYDRGVLSIVKIKDALQWAIKNLPVDDVLAYALKINGWERVGTGDNLAWYGKNCHGYLTVEQMADYLQDCAIPDDFGNPTQYDGRYWLKRKEEHEKILQEINKKQ